MLSLILTTVDFHLFIIQSDPGHILMEEEIITIWRINPSHVCTVCM